MVRAAKLASAARMRMSCAVGTGDAATTASDPPLRCIFEARAAHRTFAPCMIHYLFSSARGLQIQPQIMQLLFIKKPPKKKEWRGP